MASVAGVVCFGSGAAKSQHFSRFHTFYGHMGADVGFLKAIYDFRQQISQKPLPISVSGRQKANIELIWALRGCLRRGLLAAWLSAARFVCRGVCLQSAGSSNEPLASFAYCTQKNEANFVRTPAKCTKKVLIS